MQPAAQHCIGADSREILVLSAEVSAVAQLCHYPALSLAWGRTLRYRLRNLMNSELSVSIEPKVQGILR